MSLIKRTLVCLVALLLCFCAATVLSMSPVVKNFNHVLSDTKTLELTGRDGTPLSISYQSDWNILDHRPLYNMPDLLVRAFLFSEDKNFYTHGGVDWRARMAAAYQNIKYRHTVRGASTITEQIVRMLHPRPRNLWSKWVEGVEATRLEASIDKPTLLEFYLNQLPYAAHRRGVTQAARYYFDRDLDTLTPREILALVILARAPSAYDLYKNAGKIDVLITRMATQMKEANLLSSKIYDDVSLQVLKTSAPSLPVEARHFARHVLADSKSLGKTSLITTLDAALQSQVQGIIDQRLKKLSSKNVANAGVLVMDYTTGDILAWVSAGATDDTTNARDIDPVTTPRQPGSTLKPFLYAMALESGWTPATFLNDAPIAEAVGTGLHRFRNYSNTHYGIITLREALGNSLNIPAILTINHVGVDRFLNTLHALGFDSLSRDAALYDEGLALGNGEVTLLELVRAYAAMANQGRIVETRFLEDSDSGFQKPRNVFRPEISSIISNILSDPSARALEFGNDSLLNLPYRTAVKTGTSTDYRDAWSVGYNDKYVVGVWMGNLDRTPMKEITGSTGPALALRSIFHILNQNRNIKPLYQSPALVSADVCTRPADDNGNCPMRTDLFLSTPLQNPTPTPRPSALELVSPTKNLMVAYDPRIPKGHQKMRFELAGLEAGDEVEWLLNDVSLARTKKPTYLWDVARGAQNLVVVIHKSDGTALCLPPVPFLVR